MRSDMLEFDYEPIQGQRLVKALGAEPLLCDDDTIAFDEVQLVLSSCSLRFSVDIDTDEIVCDLLSQNGILREENKKWVKIKSLEKFLGSEIGWLWLSRSWLGYVDTAMLSFAGIEPNVIMMGMASKINIYGVTKILR
jgi:hypothetical protein